MNVDTERCSAVRSSVGCRGIVPLEHYCLDGGMCFLEGSQDRTQFSVPSRKSQTTDGSSCRGKRAAAIERERGGGAGEEGQERFSEMLQCSADSWVAIQPHKMPEREALENTLWKGSLSTESSILFPAIRNIS